MGNYKYYDKGYDPTPLGRADLLDWQRWLGRRRVPEGRIGGGLRNRRHRALRVPEARNRAPPGVEQRSPCRSKRARPCSRSAAARNAGRPAPAARQRPNRPRRVARVRAQTSPFDRGHARLLLYRAARHAGATLVKATVEIPYEEEFARYGNYSRAAKACPAYAAASPTDRVHGSECLFEAYFPQFFETARALLRIRRGAAYYAVPTAAARGSPCCVLVHRRQRRGRRNPAAWLERSGSREAREHEAAIVVGNANLNAQEEHHEGNAAEVVQAMVDGPRIGLLLRRARTERRPDAAPAARLARSRRTARARSATSTCKAPNSRNSSARAGSCSPRSAAVQQPSEQIEATVSQLIPDIGEGELVARSAAGNAAAPQRGRECSRRSREGRAPATRASARAKPKACHTSSRRFPANCVGAVCPPGGPGILPAYSFTSSDEEVGRFVEARTALRRNRTRSSSTRRKNRSSRKARTIAQGLVESKSGLFCALNTGETMVTITAGGVSASLPVTVRGGQRTPPMRDHAGEANARLPNSRSARPRRRLRRPPPPPRPPRRLRCCPCPRRRYRRPSRRPRSAPAQAHRRRPFFIQPALPVLLAPFVPPPLRRAREPDSPEWHLGGHLAGRGGPEGRRAGGGDRVGEQPGGRLSRDLNTSPRPPTCSASSCWPRSPARRASRARVAADARCVWPRPRSPRSARSGAWADERRRR